MKRVVAALFLIILAASIGGCGTDGQTGAKSETKSLTVYAAASLNGTFTILGKSFEGAHPDTLVVFNFAGSSDLVTQLQGGARADVFASADTKNMEKAVGDKLVDGIPVPFASNTLEIAVPPDNPAGISSFKDLAKPTVKLVICANGVPCGTATQKVVSATRVTLKPVSEENSVTDVLNKVENGDANAGLVYVTDVKAAAGKVKGIVFPESQKAVNKYPIAQLSDSKNKDLGKQFVDLVTGPVGQRVLSDAGFAKP